LPNEIEPSLSNYAIGGRRRELDSIGAPEAPISEFLEALPAITERSFYKYGSSAIHEKIENKKQSWTSVITQNRPFMITSKPAINSRPGR
jgi:hypothetical protein